MNIRTHSFGSWCADEVSPDSACSAYPSRSGDPTTLRLWVNEEQLVAVDAALRFFANELRPEARSASTSTTTDDFT